MTDRDECIHGLDDPAWCSICRAEPTARPAPVRPMRTFRARFDGVCSECNLPIIVGHMIVLWSDDTYRHLGCMP